MPDFPFSFAVPLPQKAADGNRNGICPFWPVSNIDFEFIKTVRKGVKCAVYFWTVAEVKFLIGAKNRYIIIRVDCVEPVSSIGSPCRVNHNPEHVHITRCVSVNE